MMDSRRVSMIKSFAMRLVYVMLLFVLVACGGGNEPTESGLFGLIWSGTQFVGVGNSGIIRTSPDGLSWTYQNSGTAESLLNVAWSGTRFTAVGNHGTILTSPDGVSWTMQTSGTIIDLYGVVWSGSQFATVGDSGAVFTSPTEHNGLCRHRALRRIFMALPGPELSSLLSGMTAQSLPLQTQLPGQYELRAVQSPLVA